MTTTAAGDVSGWSREQKQELIRRMLEKQSGAEHPPWDDGSMSSKDSPAEAPIRFEDFPEYEQLRLQHEIAQQAGIESPYFLVHEGVAGATSRIEGREVLNFSTYNYLALNGHPQVSEAALQAVHRYGTSASASRVVSGERPPHRELERHLADFLRAQDCLVFVSGHSTNVSTLSAVVGPRDLILHDRLIHSSILQGAAASGAQRLAFPHNNMDALEEILKERRAQFERVLIVVEGIYSMDGDMPPLPALIALKRRHKALLMVDEAHSIGVVGTTGRGVTEHFDVSPQDIDILMGTLSKTFASCGGFIAGTRALISLLKFTASGFVYSVGMPPPMAFAAQAALGLLRAEPNRVKKLQENGRHFLATAQALHLDTGFSMGFNIIPIIVGSSMVAARASNALLRAGINVQPIIHPAVEERSARLRFFLSSEHSFAQIEEGLRATVEQLAAIGG